MKITDLQAYKRLEKMFEQKGYSRGVKDHMPIYEWRNIQCIPEDLTIGHFVDAHKYGKIEFMDIPEEYRTREFFLHSLCSTHKDVVEYVQEHIEQFDKQFFKDHIETDHYALEFALNDFSYMPLEYIDEEMVSCAMFKAAKMKDVGGYGDCDDWFYSVYRRKPEVLSKDLYILGARCFAIKESGGQNRFLDITPEEYRTPEYYFALCLGNCSPVMEDIPESVLTTDFLVSLIKESSENIRSFSESALEKEVEMIVGDPLKFWQVAIINDGYQIRNLTLNEERIEFFLSIYDKDSMEYRFGFKDHYKRYLRKKNSVHTPKNDSTKLAGMMALAGALSGLENDEAIEFANVAMDKKVNRKVMLPIHYDYSVPKEYSKKYDGEEYLIEIYKKLGIQILDELDSYYYLAVVPEEISIIRDGYRGYFLKNSSEEILIHYYDRGPFYDRTVTVDKIYVTL